MGTGKLAKLLGVSLNTIYRWERTGYIPEPRREDDGSRWWTQDQVTEILRKVSRGA